MNVHEFQAKSVLSSFGVAVPKGVVAGSMQEVDAALSKLSSSIVAVKAQIHAGGRGKAGGVKIGRSKDELKSIASNMLGSILVTHQTSSDGQKVNKVYLEEGVDIKNEYYISAVVDRKVGRASIIFSSEGGVDIEEVAQSRPEMVAVVHVDPVYGFRGFHGRELSSRFSLSPQQASGIISIADKIYKALVETDASQIEINPLAETADGKFVALDAKIVFDDNSLYRHSDIAALCDPDEYAKEELDAAEHGLSYIKMSGNIGCMVNGAGLAMATMDIIKHYGGEPANFLDVGGGATQDAVKEAFRIILQSKVDGILVNIFGGIMRCDVIASGIIESAKEMEIAVPLVVRLSGTNFELGKKLLDNSGLKITTAGDLDEAARFIVNMVSKS